MADPEYNHRTRKFKEAQNPRIAKVFDTPCKINPYFIYPFFTTQSNKTVEFDKVREELYRSAASISGKARHRASHYQSLAEYPWNGKNTGSNAASTS